MEKLLERVTKIRDIFTTSLTTAMEPTYRQDLQRYIVNYLSGGDLTMLIIYTPLVNSTKLRASSLRSMNKERLSGS